MIGAGIFQSQHIFLSNSYVLSPHRLHIRKVGHDDDEDDPFMGNVVPITDTPWILFLLLAIGYGCYKLRKRSA